MIVIGGEETVTVTLNRRRCSHPLSPCAANSVQSEIALHPVCLKWRAMEAVTEHQQYDSRIALAIHHASLAIAICDELKQDIAACHLQCGLDLLLGSTPNEAIIPL